MRGKGYEVERIEDSEDVYIFPTRLLSFRSITWAGYLIEERLRMRTMAIASDELITIRVMTGK